MRTAEGTATAGEKETQFTCRIQYVGRMEDNHKGGVVVDDSVDDATTATSGSLSFGIRISLRMRIISVYFFFFLFCFIITLANSKINFRTTHCLCIE